MFQFKINEDIKKEKTKEVGAKLHLDHDDDLTLEIDGWDIITITKEGRIFRHVEIPDHIGFKIDEEERVSE